MNTRTKNTLIAASLAGLLATPVLAVETATHTAGEVLDDAVITTKVKAALVRDPVTKAHQISVDTYKGTVKLSGFVDTLEAENRALELARNVEGAVKVEDSLEVRK